MFITDRIMADQRRLENELLQQNRDLLETRRKMFDLFTVRECKNVQLLHFFAEIRKTLKGTREANFGRIRALGVRNLLNFF